MTSAGAYTLTVHSEGGARTLHHPHTVKAARLLAKRLAGATGVERITLAGPDVDCELWAAGDEARRQAPRAIVPLPFATIERALPNRRWDAGRRR